MEVQGGRPLARFKIFGFPVHIDASFLIIIGLLGYASVGLSGLPLWLIIATLAILIHELGHAVLARAAGAAPSIALAGFGGLTTFTPPRPLSRARSIGISLAGPGIGLVLGVVILLVARNTVIVNGSWQELAFGSAIFTTLGWSLLNLLPILPLDGGQAVRELLPGPPEVRERRAAIVSIIAGVAVAALAVMWGQYFLAVFLALFVLSNASTLRAPRAGEASASPEAEIVDLVWQHRTDEALELLAAQPADRQVDLAVHGLVLAVTTDQTQGLALLRQELARRPDDVNVPILLTIALTVCRHWEDLVGLLAGPHGHAVPALVVLRAQHDAFEAGDGAACARIGEAHLAQAGDGRPSEPGQLMADELFQIARGWAVAGEPQRAVEALRRAAEHGFADLRVLDTDPALASVRSDPGFGQAREIIGHAAGHSQPS